ncbi:hypothetical protein [Microbacterium sp. NPDC055665]
MSTEAIRAAYQRFPHDTLTINRDNRDQIIAIADTFRAAVQVGVFMSLGATDLTAVAGAHQLGGLLFTGRILPLRDSTRRERPARMGVMISHTPADEIDIHVLEYARVTEHARLNGIYIDQLNRALLALDYDGTPLNPRYWL